MDAELFSDAELARLVRAGELLYQAENTLPVLGRTQWPPELADKFIAGGARELPQAIYIPVDPVFAQETVAAARKLD